MQVVQDRYAPGVQECFRRFDEDNSGSLGSSELRGALKSLGLAVTSTQAAALVGRYDDDGSSELSVDEFNALVVSILQLQEQESAAAVTLQARRRGMSARRLSSELGARALDGALAAPHFTNLAPTDDGSLAYSELKASNLRLTDLAADLSAFAQLATLDVSHNMLRNLNGLGALPVLVTLNAAGNSLRRLLDFEPPASGSRLRVVDLRDNCISNQASADSFDHPQLETLLLDGNRMASLECLRSLRCLRRLTVSRNALRDTAGLDGLSSLEHLDLARNQLDSAEALPSLVGLRTLHLGHNRLTVLPRLSQLGGLTVVGLESNRFAALREITRPLEGLPTLRALAFADNPIVDKSEVRLELLWRLPALDEIDGAPVAPIEKISAANSHGADGPRLVAIREKLLARPAAWDDERDPDDPPMPDPLPNEWEVPGLLKLYASQYAAAFQPATNFAEPASPLANSPTATAPSTAPWK